MVYSLTVVFPPRLLGASSNRYRRTCKGTHLSIGLVCVQCHVRRAVLPNLCAAAHKYAARAVEVYRGRMSEIRSFQWKDSLKFSTVIENVQFPKFSHGTLLPLHHNITIWSVNRSSMMIFDDLFRLSLRGRCLSSLDHHNLLVLQSRTTIIAQHWVYASVEVEPDRPYYRTFWAFVFFYLISNTSHSIISLI